MEKNRFSCSCGTQSRLIVVTKSVVVQSLSSGRTVYRCGLGTYSTNSIATRAEDEHKTSKNHTLQLTIPTSTQNKQPSVEFGTCWIHSGGGGSGLVTGITWWLRVRSWQLIYWWERRVDVFPFYGLMEKRIVWLPAGWVERVETNDDEVWLATTTSCIRALFRTVKISATHAAARFFERKTANKKERFPRRSQTAKEKHRENIKQRTKSYKYKQTKSIFNSLYPNNNPSCFSKRSVVS